jgi:hypothetical protein
MPDLSQAQSEGVDDGLCRTLESHGLWIASAGALGLRKERITVSGRLADIDILAYSGAEVTVAIFWSLETILKRTKRPPKAAFSRTKCSLSLV